MKNIEIKGARTNNLKNISVDIPHNVLTVISGPSGCGKSSLAISTIHAEGQRRYIESLSPYARQLLGHNSLAEVDSITGLSPTICLDAKKITKSTRSTIGTLSECDHYLRLLFSIAGEVKCPQCGKILKAQTAQEMVDDIISYPENTKAQILAPIKLKDDEVKDLNSIREQFLKQGFVRARVNNQIIDLSIPQKNIEVTKLDLVIDRLKLAEKIKLRLSDSIQTALKLSEGYLKILLDSKDTGVIELSYSEHNLCPEHNYSIPKLTPKIFSANNHQSCCTKCTGVGFLIEISNDKKSEFEIECPQCKGQKLNDDILNVRVNQKNIAYFSSLSLDKLTKELNEIKRLKPHNISCNEAISQILRRLDLMNDLGLSYLSLNRNSHSLSGGELQRTRLASQLGAGLSGITCILDEPGAGLHEKDLLKVLKSINKLKDESNTPIIIEHNPIAIKNSDFLIDMGPGAGSDGGEIIQAGPTAEVLKNINLDNNNTAAWLQQSLEVIKRQKTKPREFIELVQASGNNLKNVNLSIPLNCLSVIKGVSGSGKSTLLQLTLAPALKYELGQLKKQRALPFKKLIFNKSKIKRVIQLDQTQLSRSARSTLATVSQIMNPLREIFAKIPEAKARGYKAARFSLNVKGGRCEHCKGLGEITEEMHYLPDVTIPCQHCQGMRYNDETCQIRFKGLSIAEILQMTIKDALSFFRNIPQLAQALQPLVDIGLDYLSLGESTKTLSEGEAQRIRLAKELGAKTIEPALFLLDEPTRGLHFKETQKLIEILFKLIKQGHSVAVIEHNQQLSINADWIVEIGPQAGDQGGQIIHMGEL